MSSLFYDAGPDAAGQKVLLATTVYDSPDSAYTFAISKSRQALADAGIPSAYLLLSGNCHVDDARNSVVKEFLKSDCTDLVFLDADVSWQERDLVALCQFDVDMVGGVYPYRRAGTAGDMPFLRVPGVVPEDGLLPVAGLPTGFLRMRRKVIEAMAREAPHYKTKTDPHHLTPLVFERTLEDGTRWGGDLNFCRKWHRMGGKMYAAVDFRLGHTGKQVIVDSLAAVMRRQDGTTLKWAADQIRAGTEDKGVWREVRDAFPNPWGAEEDVLAASVILARKCQGPIIEAGSGLTTILMAAATDQTVYCFEHSEHFVRQLASMIQITGVTNIGICHTPIVDGWYDVEGFDLPERFALGVVDGPPRGLSDRMGFFELFGDKTSVILADDALDKGYSEKLTEWAHSRNRDIRFEEFRAGLIMQEGTYAQATDAA